MKQIIGIWEKSPLEDLPSVALELHKSLKIPALVALKGPLGAGKTSLVQELARIVHPEIVPGQVLSPSYSLVNEVDSVLHMDFYRLQSEKELDLLELMLYIPGKDFILVEWGEDYLHAIKRQIGGNFFCYLLEITVEGIFRNFRLYQDDK